MIYTQSLLMTAPLFKAINKMEENDIIDLRLNSFLKDSLQEVSDCNAKKCFICNKELDNAMKFNVILCKVDHSETDITEILGRLLEDDWIVVVSEDDFICCRCMALINQMDELELRLKNIKYKITDFLKNNYNLTKSVKHKVNNADVTVNMNNEQDMIQIPNRFESHHEKTSQLRYNKPKNHVRNSFIMYKHIVKKYLNFKMYKKEAVYQRTRKHNLNLNESEKVFCDACGCFMLQETIETHDCVFNTNKYKCCFCNVCFNEKFVWCKHEKICGNNVKKKLTQNDSTTKIKIESNLINLTNSIDSIATNRMNSLDSLQRFDCPKSHTEIHITSENKEKNVKLENEINVQCPTENQEFINCDKLAPQHIDNTYVSQTYKCEYCHLSFPHKSMKQHVSQEHIGLDYSKQCNFCEEKFQDEINLKVHMDTEHTFIIFKTSSMKSHLNEDSKNCDEEDDCKSDRSNLSSVSKQLSEQGLLFCAICNNTTNDYSEMENHVKRHKICDFNYCRVCSEFILQKDYRKHLNHGLNFQALQCKFCTKQCHDTLHLKFHVNKSHKDEKNQHKCKYCIKVYSEKSALEKHIKAKHNVEIDVKCCNICKVSFKNEKHLNNHVEYAHRKSLDCKFCGKLLQNLKKLQYHEKAHLKHNKAIYKCDLCNKILKTQTGLRFHKIRHTGNFPYVCEFCGQGFVSSHTLTEHIGHHIKETRYTCDVCGKGFFYYDTMYRHRILHDNPYPKSCDICDKKFRNSSRVAIHKRREHTGERPYKCTYCPQSFFTSNGYKHHMCHHTKVFPYNCQQCSKGFTTRHKYAIHLSRKHGDHSMLINRAPNNKEWNEQWLK